MAITIDKSATAIPFHDKSADRLRKTFKFTGPASYTTGGETISPANDLGMSVVHAWLGSVVSNGTVILICHYVASTGKLKYFDLTGAEISAATDLSTYIGYAEVIGR